MLSVVRRILAFDRRGLASLVLFAMRRRDGVPPGAVAVSYAGGQTAMQVALLGVATVEVVGVEFLLRGLGAPEGLRVAFLMGGLFSVLFVCTVITGCITRPHVLTDGELRIRYGVFFDLRIPREAISSMRVVRDFEGGDHHGRGRRSGGRRGVPDQCGRGAARDDHRRASPGAAGGGADGPVLRR